MDKDHKVSLRAIWLSVGPAAVLPLLNLTNSYTVFGAILALTTAGLYMSCMIVIACILYARCMCILQAYKAFDLGRWALPVNVFALTGSLYLILFHLFPTNVSVTWTNMNYALPINAAAWPLAMLWY